MAMVGGDIVGGAGVSLSTILVIFLIVYLLGGFR
jgi:hypothetical protein